MERLAETVMAAARFYAPGEPLRVEQIPVPRPAADEVLVRVRATGLCGSDVHIAVEGITPTPYRPIVLGHEVAGTIAGWATPCRGGPSTTGFRSTASSPTARARSAWPGAVSCAPTAASSASTEKAGWPST